MQLFASPAKVAGRGHGHRRGNSRETLFGGHPRDIEMSCRGCSRLILPSWYSDDVGSVLQSCI